MRRPEILAELYDLQCQLCKDWRWTELRDPHNCSNDGEHLRVRFGATTQAVVC
jgi:hypothetical protein